MNSYDRILNSRKKKLNDRIVELKSKQNTPSNQGMIHQAKTQMDSIKNFLNSSILSNAQEDMIDFLLKRGYDCKNSYGEIHQPEFVKKFNHKEVRVKVNYKGIIISLDSLDDGLVRNHSLKTPNRKKIDFFNNTINIRNISKVLIYWEKRADNKEMDDKIIKDLNKGSGSK